MLNTYGSINTACNKEANNHRLLNLFYRVHSESDYPSFWLGLSPLHRKVFVSPFLHGRGIGLPYSAATLVFNAAIVHDLQDSQVFLFLKLYKVCLPVF